MANLEGNIAAAEPELEAPGKGLPFIEWFVAKYFIVPKVLKNGTIASAIEQLNKEAEIISQIALSVSPETATKRILIPRLAGLEDSSRYWSIAMTVEHLRITTSSIRMAIKRLEKGEVIKTAKSTADVKPQDVTDIVKVNHKFNLATQELIALASSLSAETRKLKFPHTWFGPLTTEQWIIFAPQHYKIHRRQVQEIYKRLSQS